MWCIQRRDHRASRSLFAKVFAERRPVIRFSFPSAIAFSLLPFASPCDVGNFRIKPAVYCALTVRRSSAVGQWENGTWIGTLKSKVILSNVSLDVYLLQNSARCLNLRPIENTSDSFSKRMFLAIQGVCRTSWSAGFLYRADACSSLL